MAQASRGILEYETTLNVEARARLAEIETADIVVGIPCHRNSRTIGAVTEAIAEGIAQYLPGKRVVLMGSDGGSSDSTLRHVEQTPVPANVEKLLTVYEGPNGKGTAVRSIFEATGRLGARACAVFEARVPGIDPTWVPSLLDPVLQGTQLVLPCYARDPFSASLAQELVTPFVRTFLDADLVDPVASELALSGSLAADLANRDVWETDVSRFGVNIWIPLEAVVGRWRTLQVGLGDRGEGTLRPISLTDPRFLQVVGTLFRLLSTHRRIWQGTTEPLEVPFHGTAPDGAGCDALDECAQQLYAAMNDSRRRYQRLWKSILTPDTFAAVKAAVALPLASASLPDELWSRVVLEFAVSFNEGEGDPDKVIEALLPLFYERAALHLLQTGNQGSEQRKAYGDELFRSFVAAKPAFVRQWQRNLPYGVGQSGTWFM
jgi:hypothetical protein